jgi:hypothetical protein
MVRKLVVALILVAVSVVLGATVLREPIARAAEKLTPVFVTNDAANAVPVAQQGTADVRVANASLPVQQQGTADVRVTNAALPVQQQGTADVRVTNGSLTVAPAAPVTGIGRGIGTSAGGSVGVVDSTASAISLTMSDGVTAAEIKWRDANVAFFYGPALGGERSVVLALSRPIRLDELVCSGSSGACRLGWVGAEP